MPGLRTLRQLLGGSCDCVRCLESDWGRLDILYSLVVLLASFGQALGNFGAARVVLLRTGELCFSPQVRSANPQLLCVASAALDRRRSWLRGTRVAAVSGAAVESAPA